MESRHLLGCSPHPCQCRIDGLDPVSMYRTYRSHAGNMSPISLVTGRQQKVGFAPTISMVVLGEKLHTDPQIGLLACYGLCREPIFSGAVTLLNSVVGAAFLSYDSP
jgi:hypothetical protein